jgi:hypothetical protein
MSTLFKFTHHILMLILLTGCASLQEFAYSLFSSLNKVVRDDTEVATSVPFLQRRVRMIFPREIKTVGEAVDYLLEPYDFKPMARDPSTQSISVYEYTHASDVSAVPLFVAIKRIMGEEYKIVFDSKQQLYAMQLKSLGDNPIAFTDLSLFDSFVNNEGPINQQRQFRPTALTVQTSESARMNINSGAEQKTFLVARGSLRDNAIRLTRDAEWQTDASEWFIAYDYTVKSAFTISYYSLDDALTTLLEPYRVAAIFLDDDRKVVFEEM